MRRGHRILDLALNNDDNDKENQELTHDQTDQNMENDMPIVIGFIKMTKSFRIVLGICISESK